MSVSYIDVIALTCGAVAVIGGLTVWWRTARNRRASGTNPPKRAYSIAAYSLVLAGILSVILSGFMDYPQSVLLATLSLGYFFGAFKAYKNGQTNQSAQVGVANGAE